MIGRHFEISYDRWIGWFMGLLGTGRRFSGLDVGPAEIVVRMGWAFRARLQRSAIRGASAHDGRMWSWGAHGWRGRWLVNGSSSGIVRIDIDPPQRAYVCGFPIRLRELYVSVDEGDELIAALS